MTETLEATRLHALHELGLLDTPAEPRFDRLTRLAQRLFDVPMALINLVTDDRVWSKSRQGLDAPETPRAIAFCDLPIRANAPVVIPDLTTDPRTAANPLVTGPFGARFYAGHPLVTPTGEPVGTICLIAQEPRFWSAADQAAFTDLAEVVQDELTQVELARALHRAEVASNAEAQFLANMSHELRTPLNAILGFSELLAEDAEAEGRAQALADVNKVHASGMNLLAMIDQLLGLKDPEPGSIRR
jgi:GAF domain-containing protein